MKVLLLLGRKTKEFCWSFSLVFGVPKGAFCRKFHISTGRNRRLKQGKRPNLTERIINKKKTEFKTIALVFREWHFSKRQAILLYQPSRTNPVEHLKVLCMI